MSELLTQYKAIKAKYPDAVLLFRIGDFYETFNEDAEIISQQLGLTLSTLNDNDVRCTASLPYHALDHSLRVLVKAGYRVAICDQLEDPKTAQGTVKRGVSDYMNPDRTIH